MPPNAPTSDKGTARPGITVAQSLLRNRKITITTSTMVINKVISTSATEARMVKVRSASISTFTEGGRKA